jgi:hypothetical protein
MVESKVQGEHLGLFALTSVFARNTPVNNQEALSEFAVSEHLLN